MLLLRANSVLLLALMAIGGCATRIVPPAKPINPVAVYVTDYGRHSSILLPMGDGHLMEYSYGDWEFYALNRYKWYIGASKLIYSDGSGLGRRIVPHPGEDAALQKLVGSKRLLRVDIEHSRVMELLDELDRRYNGRIETLIKNSYVKQDFVKDDAHYGLFHTCNGETAAWLRKLGCEVDGLAVMSNFELAKPKEPALARAKATNGYAEHFNGGPIEADPVQLSQQRPGAGKSH